MKKVAGKIFVSLAVISLSACSGMSQPDYAPAKNKIVGRTYDGSFDFVPQTAVPLRESRIELADAVTKIGADNIRQVEIFANNPATAKKRRDNILSTQRIRSLESQLKNMNVPSDMVKVSYRPAGDLDSAYDIKISYTGIVLPECDKVHTEYFDYYMNYQSRDLGCQVNHNLGAMVVDPSDTVQGRGNIVPDGTASVAPITAYRNSFTRAAGGGAGGASGGATAGATTTGGN